MFGKVCPTNYIKYCSKMTNLFDETLIESLRERYKYLTYNHTVKKLHYFIINKDKDL